MLTRAASQAPVHVVDGQAAVGDADARRVVDTAKGEIRVGAQVLLTSNPLDDLKNGQKCTLAIRPEAITLAEAAR